MHEPANRFRSNQGLAVPESTPSAEVGAKLCHHLRRAATLAAVLLLSASARSNPAEGLSFHAGFSAPAPLTADFATGVARGESADATAVPDARLGDALRTAEGARWPLIGNFRHAVGTICFWVRRDPEAPVTETGGKAKDISLFDTANFSVQLDPTARRLHFLTGTDLLVEGFKWDYTTSAVLPADALSAWTHVAITWDANAERKKIFLAGREVASIATPRIRRELHEASLRLRFGARGFLVDEATIWNRVLAPEEIAALVADPAGLAAAVAKAPRPAPEVAPPLTFGLHRARDGKRIFAPGQLFALAVPLQNTSAAHWRGTVTFELVGFDERPLESIKRAVDLAPGAATALAGEFRAPRQGIYKVAARISSDAAPVDVASFVVWPENSVLRDDSFFGVHVNSWSEALAGQSARLGFRWNRNHNMLQTTWWPRVQPEPGDYRWLHDPSLELNEKLGFRVLGQFFGTPWWAAAAGPLAKQEVTRYNAPYPYGAKPDLKKYRDYVFQTVTRYKGRIRFWETWNEPDVATFWSGSPAEYAELCRVTYEAAKAADPDCVVMVGGFATGWRWAEKAAEHGAFKHADAISMHLYFHVDPEAPRATPEAQRDYVRQAAGFFRSLAARHGRSPDMPLWQTEGGASVTSWLRGQSRPGWPPPAVRPPTNWREAAYRVVQSEIFLQEAGFARSFSYVTNPESGYKHLTDLEIDDTPRPHALARAALARAVDGRRFHAFVDNPAHRFGAAVYAGSDAHGSLVVAWTAGGGELSLPTAAVGPLTARRDLFGALEEPPASAALRVTDAPQYWEIAESAEAVVERLRTASFEVVRAPKPLGAAFSEADKPAGAAALPDYATPAENPEGLYPLDLRPFANAALADGGKLDGLRDLPHGRHTWFGVPFEIIDPATNHGRAYIALPGPKNPAAEAHKEPRGIPVNRERVRALYFLHAAAGKLSGRSARYVVRYADGTAAELPIVAGVNIGDWWRGTEPKEESRPVPLRAQDSRDGKPGWRYPRVWEWQNPKPDVPITSLDFVSDADESAPAVIAVTVATWR